MHGRNGVRGGGVHGMGGMRCRGHAWQGVCAVGGMHGKGHAWWGTCVVGGMCGRGHAWQEGGMHDWGTCMVGGHAWQGARHTCSPRQILRDTVNERAVRILLECILVYIYVFIVFPNSVLILLVVFSRDVRTS